MARRVAIVAVAQTKYDDLSKNNWKYNWEEVLHQSVKPVLEETGLTFAEDGTGIDASISCHDHMWVGSPFSGGKTDDPLGTHFRPGDKIDADGAMGVTEALWQISSGDFDVVIVGAINIESAAPRNRVQNFMFDPFYQRLMGLDMLTAAALQARRYMYKYGITREQCAKVVVKNRRNAQNNPYAYAPADLSIEDVLSSTMLAHPITVLETKPIVDGSCTMILADEAKAKKITNKPIWIKGVKNCYDGYYLGDRDLADCKSLVVAAQGAYRMAGITDPRREVDVAEIVEEFSYQELLWYEGLGFCAKGEGGKLMDSGATDMGGELTVNPSGGVLSGCPYTVEGAARIAEAVLQLRGEAGARQVSGARTALAHSTMGACGQWQQVMILSKDM